MTVVYVTRPGTTLAAESRALVVRDPDGVRTKTPVLDLERVAVVAPAHLTASALSLCAREGVELAIADRGVRALGILGGSEDGLELRSCQHLRAREERFRLRVARSIVIGKIRNQRRFLGRSRGRDEATVREARDLLGALVKRARGAQAVKVLRGLEGRASAAYFSAFGVLLNPEYGFEGRNRRPPRDAANSLLSFSYMLLTAEGSGAVVASGLEPALGVYHRPRGGRPALGLDLIEEYRAPVGDALVLQATGRRIIKPSDFRDDARGPRLKPGPKRRLLRLYERKMTRSFKLRHGKRTTLRGSLRGQAVALSEAIRTGGEYQPFVFP